MFMGEPREAMAIDPSLAFARITREDERVDAIEACAITSLIIVRELAEIEYIGLTIAVSQRREDTSCLVECHALRLELLEEGCLPRLDGDDEDRFAAKRIAVTGEDEAEVALRERHGSVGMVGHEDLESAQQITLP